MSRLKKKHQTILAKALKPKISNQIYRYHQLGKYLLIILNIILIIALT